MAVMKGVCLKLGRDQDLDDVVSRERSSGYERAWEIVNDVEGYEPFIDALKK